MIHGQFLFQCQFGLGIKKPKIPCTNAEKLTDAVSVPMGGKEVRQKVTMIGGGLVGCETDPNSSESDKKQQKNVGGVTRFERKKEIQ